MYSLFVVAPIVCRGVVLGLCFVLFLVSFIVFQTIILLRKRVMVALNVFLLLVGC